jgi:hypothetical protein
MNQQESDSAEELQPAGGSPRRPKKDKPDKKIKSREDQDQDDIVYLSDLDKPTDKGKKQRDGNKGGDKKNKKNKPG